jgi:parvulin-like peptidyl-prolyl isomerase
MRACFALIALFPIVSAGTVVLDRIAVVVGRHVVKTSDIDREVRLTDFLNGQRLDLSPAARRKAADRLIDQQLIRDEIAIGGYATATRQEAEKLLAQIKAGRFHGDAAFRAALRQYGITEPQLESQLLWQLTVLKFIEQRFRPGVLVSDQQVRDYYNQHQVELRRTSGTSTSLDALRPKIEEILTGEQVNQQFFAWLEQARKQTRVEFREDAFQ